MGFLLVSLLFLRPVNYASLKYTLREVLISLHCMEVSVLCLQSFEKVQGCGSFLAFDMFCYTKHLTAEKYEISWYISHVWGAVR